MALAAPVCGQSLWPAGRFRYFERLLVYLQPPSWAKDAACRGSGLDPTDEEHTEALTALCGSCPVREQCRAEAMRCEALVGVWGGTTSDEREAWRGATRLVEPVRVPEHERAMRAKRALKRGRQLARWRGQGVTRRGGG